MTEHWFFDGVVQSVGPWLLTYLLHSSAVIGVVWLATRFLPSSRAALQHFLWKCALFLPILTASAQHLAQGQLAWQSIHVETPSTQAAVAPRPTPAPTPTPVILQAWANDTGGFEFHSLSGTQHAGTQFSAPIESDSSRQRSTPSASTPSSPLFSRSLVAPLLLGAVALMSLFSMVAFIRRSLALRALLKNRQEVVEDPGLETFLQLCSSAKITRKVRLTQVNELPSPVALWNHEICVPTRLIHEATPGQLQAALAHELAHIERGDPIWNVFACLVEALFAVQPLNRIARRGLQDSMEILCDDWAVRQTGSGIDLAKSLATVASWKNSGQAVHPFPAMMGGSGGIRHRVAQVLADSAGRIDPHAGRWAGPALVGLVGLSLFVLPGFSAASSFIPQHETQGNHWAPSAHIFEEACANHDNGCQLGLASIHGDEALTHRQEERQHEASERQREASERQREASERHRVQHNRQRQHSDRVARKHARKLEKAQRKAARAQRRAARAAEQAREAQQELEALHPRGTHRRTPPAHVPRRVAPPAPPAPPAPQTPSERAPRVPSPPPPPMGALMDGLAALPQVLEHGLQKLPTVLQKEGARLEQEATKLAGIEHDLGQKRAELERARARGSKAEIGQLEKDAALLKKARNQAARRVEKQSKAFEKKMERWGEEFGRSMEAWGKDLEKAAKRDAKVYEAWGEGMGQQLENTANSPNQVF